MLAKFKDSARHLFAVVIHVLAEQTPVSHIAIESPEYLLKNVDFELATDRSIRLYVLPSIFFFFFRLSYQD